MQELEFNEDEVLTRASQGDRDAFGLIDKIIRMGVGLLVGIWIARYLGPGQFGLYNYALSFVALFSAFATRGLDGIVVRDIVRDPSCKDETLGTAFVLKLIGGIVTFLLVVGAISLLRPHDRLTQWLVGITALGTFFQAFDTIDFWFQSQVKSKHTVYSKNTAFLLITLIKIVFILTKAPLIAFAWAGLTEIVVGAIGLVIVYRMNGHHIKAWQSSMARAKSLFSDSWPLILSGIVIMIYLRIDQVMLGEMVGNEEVGIYSVAVRLAEAWYFIPMAIFSSVFPSIVESRSISETLFYERLQPRMRGCRSRRRKPTRWSRSTSRGTWSPTCGPLRMCRRSSATRSSLAEIVDWAKSAQRKMRGERRMYVNSPASDISTYLGSAAKLTASRDAAFHTLLQAVGDVARDGVKGSGTVKLSEVLGSMGLADDVGVDKALLRMAKMSDPAAQDLAMIAKRLGDAEVPIEVGKSISSTMRRVMAGGCKAK